MEQEEEEKAKRRIAEQRNEEALKCLEPGRLLRAFDYNRVAISLDSMNTSFYYTQALIHYEVWKQKFSGKKYGKRTPDEEMTHGQIIANCNLAINLAGPNEEKAKAYYLRARQNHDYWDKKVPNLVLEDINKAVELTESKEEKAKILNTLAEMYFDWYRPREALDIIERALKLDNSNIRLHINSARSHSILAKFRDDPNEKSARIQKAKGALYRARELAMARNDENLAQWIEQKLDELDNSK